jgi:hypothetical protein
MTTREILPTECPVCGHEELELERDRSRFDQLPQVAALRCEGCGYQFDEIAERPEDNPEADGQFWRAEAARCRVCSHLWAAVFPLGTDEDALECPNGCGFTGEATGELEDEEDAEE